MKIPKEIKVNGIPYQVVMVSDLHTTAEKYGQFDGVKQRITLSSTVSQERQEKTFIHELLHAIFYETGVSKWLDRASENLEEDMVEVLAPVLLDVLGQVENGK